MSDSQQDRKPMTIAQLVPVEKLTSGEVTLGQTIDGILRRMALHGTVDGFSLVMTTSLDVSRYSLQVEVMAMLTPPSTVWKETEGGPAENGPAPRGLPLRDSL